MPQQSVLLDSGPARTRTQPRARATSVAPEPIAVRVARGAAEFDRLRPGWAEGINVGRLDVQDATGSPEAQTFGSLKTAMIVLFPGNDRIETADLVGLGLAADPQCGDEYPELAKTWRVEVGKRFEAGEPPLAPPRRDPSEGER